MSLLTIARKEKYPAQKTMKMRLVIDNVHKYEIDDCSEFSVELENGIHELYIEYLATNDPRIQIAMNSNFGEKHFKKALKFSITQNSIASVFFDTFGIACKSSNLEFPDKYSISLGKHICRLLFTFGIWLLIWIYRTTDFTNKANGEGERSPTSTLLLYLFVPFYSIYWTYKTAQRIDLIAKDKGINSDLGTVCLLLAIFIGFIPPILMQDKINEIVKKATT